MTRRFGSIAALGLVFALFFGVNILAGAVLRGARLDLTEDRLYTLSEGSRRVARSVDEPLRLTFYYSERASDGLPQAKAYAARVREILEEFVLASGGNITLEVVDPRPFTDEEDRAVAAGLAGIPVRPGSPEVLYLGLVGTNATDGREVIPFFDPSTERFLEYDIARLVHALTNPKRASVAVISSLPIDGERFNPMTGMPEPGRPWQVYQQLRSLFDVEPFGEGIAEIPEETDILFIVHPKDLPETTVYAIDQFVLRGGRAIVFVDPQCDAEVPAGAERNPLQAMMADKSSDLPGLFTAWGVRLDQGKFAADIDLAIRVPVGQRGQSAPYVAYLAVREGAIDRDDAVSGQLSLVQMGAAGILDPVEGATTTVHPLLTTTEQSMRMGVERIKFPEPQELLASFNAGGQRLTLAARITGRARSAFPGRPREMGGVEGEDVPAHVPEGEVNVIVVADVDMLTDRFWVQEQTFQGLSLGLRKIADNGDFVLAAVENLAGSSDLIGVRARGRFARPFERIEEIQREAEVRYQAEQKALQDRQRQTEQRINELQRQRPGDQAQGGLILLTPEQQAEIEAFQQELVHTRRQLREVQANMRRDIEVLQTRLKFANIALVPLVVTLAALALGAYRVGRRRSGRRLATAAESAAGGGPP